MALDYPNINDQKWTKKVTIASGQTSTPIQIPNFIEKLAIQVDPNGGSSLVQTTCGPSGDVDVDPDSVAWSDWDAGAVGVVTSQASIAAVTFVRAAASGGQPTDLYLSGNRRAG